MVPGFVKTLRDRALVLALTVGMGAIALGVGAIYGTIIYHETLDQYRLQLAEMVRMQADLVEESARLERDPLTSEAVDYRGEIIRQLREGLLGDGHFGETGQLQVVEVRGDSIHFIFPELPPIAIEAAVGAPSRQAVAGIRGTLSGLDYRGVRVLAATDFVPTLGVGMVAKVDLAEFRSPFVRSSILTGLLALLLVGGASALYIRIARPYLRAREESSLLDAVLESAPQGVILEGGDGTLIRTNGPFDRIVGRGTGELLGRRWTGMLFAPEEEARFDLFRERLRSETMEVEEFHLLRPNRQDCWIRVSGTPAPLVGEGVLLMTIEDTTESYRVREVLTEKERRYRELAESSSDLFFASDPQGNWTFLNRATESVYGLPPEQLLGRSVAERVTPEYLAKDTAALESILMGGTVVNHETIHRSIDGEDRHLIVSSHPITDMSGRIVGAQGIARDVTAQRKLEEDLRRVAHEASAAAEAKSAFLANMSHEIRTPMNGIMGMAQLLSDMDLSQDQRHSVEIIETSAEALLGVLDDILDLSKLEAGQLRLERIPLEVSAIAESVLQILSPRAHGQGTELILDVSPETPSWVLGDPHRLRQILLNLVGNAIKFTKGGEVVLSVHPARDRRQYSIVFSVRDTGIGIPAGKLSLIFEEFAQADSSITRTHGGTGLGLSLSRRLVRMMGGELRVTSVEGEGSDFFFDLPMDAVEPPEAKLAPRPVNVAGRRFLIVDDNQTNRRVLDGYLKYAGAEVIEADSLKGAVSVLEELGAQGRIPDAAILDQAMPGGSGVELAERLRADPRFAPIPLLMLTSSGRHEDPVRARAAGIRKYLYKPIRREQLLQVLADVLADAPGASTEPSFSGQEPSKPSPAAGSPIAVPAPAAASGDEASAFPGGAAPLRILLAEDNAVNQMVAVSMLRKRGYEVVTVENGQEALDRVRSEHWDLVLMDVQMPVMDGIEAVRLIRAEGIAVPILALTAHALEEERERTSAAGMDGFIAKPFRADVLFAEVERALRRISGD